MFKAQILNKEASGALRDLCRLAGDETQWRKWRFVMHERGKLFAIFRLGFGRFLWDAARLLFFRLSLSLSLSLDTHLHLHLYL